MSSKDFALLVAAAGVGFAHAILPDHWVPLALVGRTRQYSLARMARLSGLAGVTHVLVSILLGALIIGIGLQFRSDVQSAQDAIVGGLLIATGLTFAALELAGRGVTGAGRGHPHPHPHQHPHPHGDAAGHHHHDHAFAPARQPNHDHASVPPRQARTLAAMMVPFGAAASPDLTILPVFLAAATAGVATAVGSLLIFAAVTIGTIVGLTLAAASGAYRIRGAWFERWGNALTAPMLIAIGVLVLVGLI